MMPRLGSIEFINSLPVDLGILDRVIHHDLEITQGTPAQLNEKMLKGELDISPISLFWYAQHSSEFVLLPNLSISSKSGVQSVLLFSRVPMKDMKGKNIAITDKGRTTPALLEILCRMRYGFQPYISQASSNFGAIPQGFDAVLLIGDEALTAKETHKGTDIHVIDLAEEWQSWTKTPVVFAVWAVRRKFYEEHRKQVLQVYEMLFHSKAWGLDHLDRVIRRSREKTELSEEILNAYFSHLDYGLHESLKASIQLFWDYAAQCHLLPATQNPEFISTLTAPSTNGHGSAHPKPGVDEILERALAGDRVTVEEGVRLYYEADLFDLGMVANQLCLQKNPGADKRATFVVDRNINYTNYCYTLCKFCAFYRLPGDKEEGYLRTHQEIFDKIDELLALGGTQVLLQGGHNPDLGIEYYEDIVNTLHKRYPQVHIHSFSASEVVHIAKVSKMTYSEVLSRLKKVVLNSLPGGGAEILVDRVRQLVSPLKTKVADYFAVHQAAHELGLKSTSTMVYGLGETIEERMIHLDHYRTLQDKTGGFRAFIPWSFESESTEMTFPRRTGAEYLKMIALCRIMLDNIQHLQAGWVTEGPKLSQVALTFGADDFGGILMEENVVSATKSDKLYAGVTKDEAIRLIRETGKTPVQRNTNYEVVRVYSEDAALAGV